MAEYDQEEAFYYWVLSDVCSLIRRYGYTKVLTDIDKALRTDDLEVELRHSVGLKSTIGDME